MTLLGDSAHAMLPYLAQGAAQSIEDGCVLAAVLANAPGEPEAALKRYEALRLPRTSRIQLGARARGRINHLSSRWSRFRRDASIACRNWIGPQNGPQDLAWIYRYDAGSVPTEILAD